MSVSENIKRLREAYNLSQDELGKIAGVSGKAVSKWENGLSDPRMGAVEKMAAYFGVPKSVIIDAYDIQDEKQQLLERAFSDSPEQRELFKITDKATKEELETIIKIARSLVSE